MKIELQYCQREKKSLVLTCTVSAFAMWDTDGKNMRNSRMSSWEVLFEPRPHGKIL